MAPAADAADATVDAARASGRALAQDFHRLGWVRTEPFDAERVAAIVGWADDVAHMDDATGVLHHRERTRSGVQLCRSEDFVTRHPDLGRLLTTGVLVGTASILLGEPAALYKEKINYKLPGGAGFSAHQDAPAYRFIDTHVSCLVAIDDVDVENGCLEVASGVHHEILPMDERGCIRSDVADGLDWRPVPLRAGEVLWFDSRTPHRSGPNLSDRPRRALYPTYTIASAGDLRTAYYAAKRAAFASEPGGGARISLIGDFEGEVV